MADQWLALRRFTQARIALGHAGHALPTKALLEFQLDHAQARDAVQLPWDIKGFAGQVRGLEAKTIILETQVTDRAEYLRRPDLGRLLSERSRTRLQGLGAAPVDLALIITNGLSSTAVERHGIPLLREILNGLRQRRYGIAPVSLVANGRVALLDEIGSRLAARMAVIIVGERPGLSCADSLGMYLSYAPRPGNTDAQRNCVSNIRPPEGLSYLEAVAKLLHLIDQAMARRISGVELKDETAIHIPHQRVQD
jgi:ethanolamine ammonia-lyase small subunit